MSRDLTEWEVSTLKERILKADVVVRARLASKAVSNRSIYEPSAGRIDYFPYVEFTFTVLETLKGTAASTIIVELVVSPPIYDVPSTATDAEQKATDWKDDWYDSQWDDRDAILFLADIDNTAEAHTFSGRSSDVEYVFVGHRSLAATSVNAYDDWSIRGKYNKTWLPANSTTAGAETFYLESPDEEEDPDTVTLSSLKSSITSVLAEVRDSVPGHRECLIAKEVEERVVRPAGYWYDNQVEIESGLPAGTVLAVLGASGSRIYHRHHLYGDDAPYFDTTLVDEDTDPRNGYDGNTRTVRPLPAGRYVVEEARQLQTMVPCDYIPSWRGRWTFIVTAPVDTLHELFFDPETFGSSAVADATDGVLEPRNFTGAYGQAATIQRIEWESGTVKVGVHPDDALAGHIVDFIELDGTVSLSLDVADATADAANDTLSWSVSEQPWHGGDKLMVRIREAPLRPPPAAPVLSNNDPPLSAQQDATTPMAMSRSNSVYGPTTLEERIISADLVLRARLQSKAASSRWVYDEPFARNIYFPFVDFTFEVLEVIRGSAGSSVVVELKAAKPFFRQLGQGLNKTAAESEQRARDWLNSEYYDDQWEDRDAILFLMDIAKAENYGMSGRPSSVLYAFVGPTGMEANAYDGEDGFSIASEQNKAWLPAINTTAGTTTFYLEGPDAEGNADDVSLSSLKSLVASAVSLIDTSKDGYQECLVAKKYDEREVKSQDSRMIETGIGSGLPARSLVINRVDMSTMTYWYFHLYGDDAAYFNVAVVDADDNPENGYDGSIRTARPLPARRYAMEEARQLEVMVPCGYIPPKRIMRTINVTAPVGVLHELFFDPVTVGSAVAANATNGVLKPSAFTDANGASATLSSISYESSTVKMILSLNDALDHHVLDFIELDGTVSLSLDVADATVDPSTGSGQAGTLSWSVSEQPWEDGDKLMVRIREAR